METVWGRNGMRKWIGYYQNIISNDLCDKLIDYSDNQKPLQPSTYSTSSGKSDRSNEWVKMDDGWFRNGEKYSNDIQRSSSVDDAFTKSRTGPVECNGPPDGIPQGKFSRQEDKATTHFTRRTLQWCQSLARWVKCIRRADRSGNGFLRWRGQQVQPQVYKLIIYLKKSQT